MACYDDFQGVYFTVQSLRLHHRDVIGQCELLVIDNHPQSPEGEMVKNFVTGWVKGDFAAARYVPAPDVVGTSAPRDRVFREAGGNAVVCVDSHVLLWPGAVRALIDWFDADHDSPDLISGPMLYDDLKNFSDHFIDQWRSEMWGIWGTTWHCPCGYFHFTRREDGVIRDGLSGVPIDSQACPICGRSLKEASPETDRPFAIPAMGLGLFACRKAAWLGFNENFRGFGGEEFYIHRKYQRTGAACLSLPAVKWLHRFGRPGGVKYPLTRWNKVRNYVIGHRELGLSLDPVKAHFLDGGLITRGDWDHLLSADPPPLDPPSAEAKKCGTCGGGVVAAAADIDSLFDRVSKTPSDINEHCERLKDLAAQCESVTEFGVRHGVSTVALLAGRPQVMRSYDVVKYSEVQHLERLATQTGQTRFEFIQGSSLTVEIEPTDLLFIDTLHNAKQLSQELERHAPQTRKWIVLHDTEIYGEHGDDGGPGLLHALRKYLREHPEWSVRNHYQNNYGLTVLTRLESEKKPLPGKIEMGVNFMTALATHTVTGAKQTPLDVYEQRLAICTLCELRNGDRCSKCGCPILDKAKWAEQECPLGKWPA
jgi:cephalosporin hydroxylase